MFVEVGFEVVFSHLRRSHCPLKYCPLINYSNSRLAFDGHRATYSAEPRPTQAFRAPLPRRRGSDVDLVSY